MNNQQKIYIFLAFYLICVITPLFIIWIFFGGDINKPVMQWKKSIYISIAVVIGILLLQILFILLKLINLNTIVYVAPFALAMLALTYSHPLPMWARVLIMIGCVLIAIPLNFLSGYLEDKKLNKHI